MKIALIAVAVLAVIAAGFVFAAGPEPHIAIPGEKLWTVGPLTITSTLMGSWLAMAVIILSSLLLTRGMKLIPGKGQNFIEAIVGFILGQVEEIAGSKNARRFFPVVATFFLFILVGNWLALLPFYKTIGVTEDYGHEIFHEIQVHAEEGEPFAEKHHFLAWQMKDSGGLGIANPGAKTFKFDLHEGETAGQALDNYIVALAEFYTDFEAHDADHPSAEDVRLAFEALEADEGAPKFLHTAEEHAASLAAGGVQARVSAEGEVESPALGQTFSALEFPGDKVALVYPFFRAGWSDLSNTIALAICAFLIIEFWGFQALGLGYLGKFFIAPWKSPVMTFVGILELVSEFIRIISFSFRLFGNIFAGGVLILILTFLVPFVAPLTIYGLEMFVGLIQAIVFSLLVLVFAVGAVEHHGEEEHHEGHPDEDAAADPHHHPGAVQAH